MIDAWKKCTNSLVYDIRLRILLVRIFRIVSEVVRKALQAQKSGAEEGTDTAEDCLHTNKQFTDIISLLPAMVSVNQCACFI